MKKTILILAILSLYCCSKPATIAPTVTPPTTTWTLVGDWAGYSITGQYKSQEPDWIFNANGTYQGYFAGAFHKGHYFSSNKHSFVCDSSALFNINSSAIDTFTYNIGLSYYTYVRQ